MVVSSATNRSEENRSLREWLCFAFGKVSKEAIPIVQRELKLLAT